MVTSCSSFFFSKASTKIDITQPGRNFLCKTLKKTEKGGINGRLRKDLEKKKLTIVVFNQNFLCFPTYYGRELIQSNRTDTDLFFLSHVCAHMSTSSGKDTRLGRLISINPVTLFQRCREPISSGRSRCACVQQISVQKISFKCLNDSE